MAPELNPARLDQHGGHHIMHAEHMHRMREQEHHALLRRMLPEGDEPREWEEPDGWTGVVQLAPCCTWAPCY